MKMQLPWLVAGPLLLLLCNAAAASAPATADERVAELTFLAKRLGGVVGLNDETFEHLIMGTPRSHHTFVVITTQDSRCTACGPVVGDFETVARSFNAAKANDGSLPDVFFAVALDRAIPASIRKMGVTTIPQIFYYGPALMAPDDTDLAFRMRGELKMPRSGRPSIEALLGFVRKKSGANFEIETSQASVILAMVFLLLLVAVGVQLVLWNLDLVLKVVRNRTLWLLVSIGFYLMGVSGGVFDIIRSPPYFGVSGKRGTQITIFHPQGTQQYVVEGMIIGGLNLLAGVSAVALGELARRRKNATGGSWKPPAMGIAAMMFGLLFYIVATLYSSKNRWYRPLG